MEVFYPKYYERFSCVADKCPDSCCKEWSVDVDPAAAAYYQALSGPLGERLRQVLQDVDDGTVMTIENGRCPMWRQDGLCRIQAELGHEALCKTCQEFPRLRHDYGTFAELGLELSCPEAARLILTSAEQDFAIKILPETEMPEYDQEMMAILLCSREAFLRFLDNTTYSIPEVLSVLLLYAHEVQAELDGGEQMPLCPSACLADAKRFAGIGDFRQVQDFFFNLEILTESWRKRLLATAVAPQWDNRYKALIRYFLNRYWLQAVSDYDVLCRAKFAVVACLLIGCLGGDLIETAQAFSKEIENDPDNVETILDGAYTAPALTDTALLGLLLK